MYNFRQLFSGIQHEKYFPLALASSGQPLSTTASRNVLYFPFTALA